MLEVDDASLTAVVRVLDEAGLEAVVRDAPLRWGTSERQAGVWVRVPGEEAYAVVVIADIAPGDRPGTWRDGHGGATPDAVRGYQVGFHEPGPDPRPQLVFLPWRQPAALVLALTEGISAGQLA